MRGETLSIYYIILTRLYIGPSWKINLDVEAGRRDGRISRASDIRGNIPAPQFNVNQLTQSFAAKHLSQEDMVTLSGSYYFPINY